MTQEWSRVYFKVSLILETTLKVNFGVQNLIFHISENLISHFPSKKLTFGVTNLKIHLVEYVRMDHMGHFSCQ